MESLRIAMFSDSALPILNGVSVSLDALVTQLRHNGHSVHVFTARFPGYQDPDPNTYRFRAMESPFSKGYPSAYPPYYRMLRKFRRHDYDVLHTHTPFAIGMVGLRWGESHEIPMVSTYHTLYDRYAHYIPLPRRYTRFRLAKHTNFYYNQVGHVITPSEASLRWLRRHAVTTPITIVPTGIPRSGFFDRAESRRELGIPPDVKVMLFVGRLAQEKNLSVLFEAAALTFQKDPSLRLWLVGDGPYRAECLSMVRKLGIGDRVRFVGFVPRQDVDRYYAAADLFVFSSLTETQGLVVQEAMMYGLPAVVVGAGGVSDAVSDGVNGYVVRNDPLPFANATLQLLRDDLVYTQMSEAALRSVRSQGIGEMADSVVSVYRQTIEREREEARRGSYAWV
jgi:glycosyltransferase involved in cell wall biosynthesis